MDGAASALLAEILRRVHQPGAPARRLQSILDLLEQQCELEQAVLWRIARGGRSFERCLTARGVAALPEQRPRPRPERKPSLRPEDAGWEVPIQSGRRLLGLLELLPVAGRSVACDAALAEAIGYALVPALEQWAQDEQRRWRLGAALNHRDLLILYRTSRAFHRILPLDELIHLLLSAATAPNGGPFDRALLFMVNPRSGSLQGMLGVTRDEAGRMLARRSVERNWDWPELSSVELEKQSGAPFSRKVRRQRLRLDPGDNALARAVAQERLVLVRDPAAEPPGGAALAADLGLGPYACIPLRGDGQTLAVLVVDNALGGAPLDAGRRQFLELFASQAGMALGTTRLLGRLESAHRDLRETQERLIQQEKFAALGQMSATLAHELRNPLVSVGGFAQLLDKSLPRGTREKEYAGIIAREVGRVELLINRILDFSRQQLICFELCALPALVTEVIELERPRLEAAGITVVTELPASLPEVVGDAQQLRQVLLNLVANARDSMGTGGTLTLRAAPTLLRGDPAIAIEVCDTGGGISDENLRNLFNPFFTTREKGTGLGLPISQRIVARHHGEIEALNGPEGAIFIVRLPLQPRRPAGIDSNGQFG